MAQLTVVIFKHCLPFQPINFYQLYLSAIIIFTCFLSFFTNPFVCFSLVSYVLLDNEEILHAVRFGFDIFIYTNLSTAAQKWQGWYQRLLRNGRVESLFFISACSVCYPGLQDMCLLTQVLYIVRVMSTSNFNLANFYVNFCSSHPTT